MSLRALLVVVLAGAVGAFAAGGSGASVHISACDPGVETADGNPAPSPHTGDLVVGHRIVLVGAAAPKLHEFRDGPQGWWWLKTLIVVRPGRAVTLTVPRPQRTRLHLRYGRGSAAVVTFRPCRVARGQWSYYPGGFVYSRRGCYPLDIRIQGHAAVRRFIPLGIGASCAR